jgi:hypothetical protein
MNTRYRIAKATLLASLAMCYITAPILIVKGLTSPDFDVMPVFIAMIISTVVAMVSSVIWITTPLR